MKKYILIIILFILSVDRSFADNLLNLAIKSQIYGQNVCVTDHTKESIEFLKKHTNYFFSACEGHSPSYPRKYEKIIEDQFLELKEQAQKNSKKYAFPLAIAYAYDSGVQQGEDHFENAFYWFKVASKQNDTNAKIYYQLFKMNATNSAIESGVCNSPKECFDSGWNELVKINTARSNSLLASFAPKNKICFYAQQAVEKGSLNSYPGYAYCSTLNSKNKDLNKQMKEKLLQVIYNKNTSILAKYQAAAILKDQHLFDLISNKSGQPV